MHLQIIHIGPVRRRKGDSSWFSQTINLRVDGDRETAYTLTLETDARFKQPSAKVVNHLSAVVAERLARETLADLAHTPDTTPVDVIDDQRRG